MHRKHIVSFAVRCCLVAVAGGLVAAPSAATAADQADPGSEKSLALVKLEIRQEDGAVVKLDRGLVEWGIDANLAVGGDAHVVALNVVRPDESSPKLDVTLGYTREGTAILARHKFSTKTKARKVIRVAGGVAISVSVEPTLVKVEAPAKREKIAFENPDDPLDGLP